MMKTKPKYVLAVGIATLDVINTVTEYPTENSEVRILKQEQRRGGNATNTLITLSQLGHHGAWAGVWIDHVPAIRQDFIKYRINTHYCHRVGHGTMPTSYILLNQKNGSRSITHYRDLPEYDFAHFKQIDLHPFDWVHFEGRNIEQTHLMLQRIKRQAPALKISIEIEKNRDNIEILFEFADVLLFSRDYITQHGFNNAEAFLNQVNQPQADVFCAWGEVGAYALAKGSDKIVFEKAQTIHAIDTLGAGDVFNAGVINSYLNQATDMHQHLQSGCKLAGEHCLRLGF